MPQTMYKQENVFKSIMVYFRLQRWISAAREKIFANQEKRLEDELIRLTRKDVARRLIALEQERKPQAPRTECIRSALQRLKRDRK